MNKKSFRLTLLSILLGFSTVLTHAENEKTELTPYQMGSEYLAYPVGDEGTHLTPSPSGYTPFHIEHYGRHGSRWRLWEKDYELPVTMLRKAKKYGKLTPRGEELLAQIIIQANDAKGRYGELTPVGARQHRGIARRMTRNFPEIFTDSTLVDAKSTMVIRCILSMANEVAELQSLYPLMPVRMDASQSTQNLLAFNNLDSTANRLVKEGRKFSEEFERTLPSPENFYGKLFNDRKFVADSLGDKEIFDAIFDLAVNMQSHDEYPSIFDIFTSEELYNGWKTRNARWYIHSGNTPLTGNRVPYNQRHLLNNFIESADSAMISPRKSVNLRFGHDSMLLPLAVLMELNNAAYSTDDLTTLAENWRDFEFTPMASNIQMIFYRPESQASTSEDEILVKILLNEKEASLPLKAVSGPYYKWSDVRGFFRNKLDNFSKTFKE